MSEERFAHCACGKLEARTEREPVIVSGARLPAPARSVYEDRKHPWFSFDVPVEQIA
jgi:hypothetical protein